jgi:hypothetical protein
MTVRRNKAELELRVVRDDDRGGTCVFADAIGQSRVMEGGDLLKTHPERVEVVRGCMYECEA